MSLSVAGVWAVDVWDQTVWADDVWREGDYVQTDVSVGGRKRNHKHNYYTKKEIEALLLEQVLEEERFEEGDQEVKADARSNLKEIRASLLRQKPAVDGLRAEHSRALAREAKRKEVDTHNRKAVLEMDLAIRKRIVKAWIN